MKDKKEKKSRKLHPMSEENSELLSQIEDQIKRILLAHTQTLMRSPSPATDGLKNMNDKVDDVLYKIFSELISILNSQNDLSDIYNLSKIYYSFSSIKFIISSFTPLISNYAKDNNVKSFLYSLFIASCKQYAKSVALSTNKIEELNEIREFISYLPFFSFLIGNVDCENEKERIVCRISSKYANKELLDLIINVLSDVLPEINYDVKESIVSENGQFAIIKLQHK